jgi:Helix-turn-helix domain
MAFDDPARHTTPDLREQLQALPRGSLVPVDWILELIGEGQDGAARPGAPAVDLNVADLALLFKKKPSTVRAWIERGDFPGSYKLNGKEWRVPAAAVEAFQKAQRAATDDGDLSDWRRSRTS